MQPLADAIATNVRRPLWLLLGAVVVALIACVNVANLVANLMDARWNAWLALLRGAAHGWRRHMHLKWSTSSSRVSARPNPNTDQKLTLLLRNSLLYLHG